MTAEVQNILSILFTSTILLTILTFWRRERDENHWVKGELGQQHLTNKEGAMNFYFWFYPLMLMCPYTVHRSNLAPEWSPFSQWFASLFFSWLVYVSNLYRSTAYIGWKFATNEYKSYFAVNPPPQTFSGGVDHPAKRKPDARLELATLRYLLSTPRGADLRVTRSTDWANRAHFIAKWGSESSMAALVFT